MFYTYMLKCKDNTIYTGIAADLNKRMSEHFSDKTGSKYTKTHSAQNLECAWKSKDKSLAAKLEYYIKTLTRKQKDELIKNNNIKDFWPRKDRRKKIQKG